MPARISFRWRLSFWVAMLVVAIGAAITGSSWYLNTRMARRKAGDLFLEISRRAVQRTQSQMAKALPAIATLQNLMAGDLRHADSDRLARTLLDVLKANDGFTWVSYSDEKGDFTGAYRAGGELRINRSSIKQGKTDLVEQVVDPSGSWLPRRHEADTKYDPRTRPFYVDVKKLGKRVWTRPYVFYDQAIPGITCAAPDLLPDGTLAGVFTIDFDLNSLSSFVAETQKELSPHAELFLFTLDGTVIAHPKVSLVETSGQGGEGRLVTTTDIDDPLVRGYFSRALESHVQVAHPEDAGEIDENFDFPMDGKTWFASWDSFEIDEGQRWVVGAVAPAADFLGDVRETGLVSIGLSLAMLVGAVGVAVALARRIARPLNEVAERMRKVAWFELDDDRPLPDSHVEEIARMNDALSQMRAGLRSFGRYVPQDLVRALLRGGREAKLGGETKELTILFSDVAGFTTLSEGLEPSALVGLFGRYLDEMTKVIAARHGTVDKFIGDGIMAFWGAPDADPKHAADAVESALLCQRRLTSLAKEDASIGTLATRIGVATGSALVGNIGTPDRMNYTVMGDVVNLASRLEGLNKAYGTKVLVSEDAAKAAKERVVCRPVDVVAVKGKTRGVKVYEPLAMLADRDDDAVLLARLCEDALIFYLARDFTSAAARWEEALALRKDDGVSKTMLERAKRFAAHPPEADWTGVTAAQQK